MKISIRVAVEVLKAGDLVKSVVEHVNWREVGGAQSGWIKIPVDGIFPSGSVLIGVTSKVMDSDGAGGFISMKRGSLDLALSSYFCRHKRTESMGIRIDDEFWLRVTLANSAVHEGAT